MGKWIKIPKAVALLAFFLPWMTVSCSGTKLVSATGVGLAFGQFTTEIPQSNGTTPNDHHEMSIWLIAAIIAVVLGLALSFLRTRQASLGVMATSAAAFVLILVGTSRYSKSAMMAEAAKKQGSTPPMGNNPFGGGNPFDNSNPFGGPSSNPFGGDPSQAAAAMIHVDWHFGYWLTLIALAVAGVMAWLAYSGRESAFTSGVRDALANGGAVPPEPVATVACPSCGKVYPATTHFCPDDGTALS